MNAASRERERSHSRRPITPEEVPSLERLGDELRRLRERVGASRARLARSSELGEKGLASIEYGTRRTRRSTLERIVAALGEHGYDCEAPAALLERLCSLAGPALAEESRYAERVARRRGRRMRKLAKIEALAQKRALEIVVEAERAAEERARIVAAKLGLDIDEHGGWGPDREWVGPWPDADEWG